MEGEKQRVLLGTALAGMSLCIFVTVGIEGTLPALLLAGGKEEVGGKFVVEHDPGSRSVESSFADILLYHSIIWNYINLGRSEPCNPVSSQEHPETDSEVGTPWRQPFSYDFFAGLLLFGGGWVVLAREELNN